MKGLQHRLLACQKTGEQLKVREQEGVSNLGDGILITVGNARSTVCPEIKRKQSEFNTINELQLTLLKNKSYELLHSPENIVSGYLIKTEHRV